VATHELKNVAPRTDTPTTPATMNKPTMIRKGRTTLTPSWRRAIGSPIANTAAATRKANIGARENVTNSV